MISAQSNLTMVGLNTPSPQVFWKGDVVSSITGIKVDWEDDEQRVKIRMSSLGADLFVIEEMRLAGIVVKEI